MTLSENLEFCVEVFLSWKELCCLCENKCVSNLDAPICFHQRLGGETQRSGHIYNSPG